jgi:hypothetical protein
VRAFLALVGRDVRERRALLPAAAAAAIVAAAVPLVRGLRGADAATGIALLSGAFAGLLGAGVAIGLGASMLPGAISSRRIGFDLARPVSTAAIWAARSIAGIGLALAAAAIALIPALLSGSRLTEDAELPEAWPWMAGLALVGLFAVAQAASIAVRARSAWIVADAAVAVGLVLALIVVSRSLSEMGAWFIIQVATLVIGAGLAACLLVSGLVALAAGRCEIRRAHRAMSAALWLPCAVLVIAYGATSVWVKSAKISDMRWVNFIHPAPRGEQAFVDGPARGANRQFLVDLQALDAVSVGRVGGLFSKDGKTAVWLDLDSRARTVELKSRSGNGPVHASGLHLERWASLVAVSSDGRRVAVSEGPTLSIYDLAERRLLGSIRVGEISFAVFEPGEALRAYSPSGNGRVEILRFQPAARRLDRLGSLSATPDSLRFDHSWRLAAGSSLGGLELFDATTGSRIARLVEEQKTSRNVLFLSDGRIAVPERAEALHGVLLYGSDGALQRRIPAARRGYLVLGGEIAPGRFVMAVSDGVTWTSYVGNSETGAVEPLAEDLMPVLGSSWWSGDDPNRFEPGSLATRLFFQTPDVVGYRRLVRIDPATRRQTLILGSPQSGRPTQ